VRMPNPLDLKGWVTDLLGDKGPVRFTVCLIAVTLRLRINLEEREHLVPAGGVSVSRPLVTMCISIARAELGFCDEYRRGVRAPRRHAAQSTRAVPSGQEQQLCGVGPRANHAHQR